MNSRVSDYDLIIIGAGAAGIGACHAVMRGGCSKNFPRNVLILEAAHRSGGRGLTEELAPGIPIDLGCHWMHSASINPFVAIAGQYGFSYGKDYFPINFFLGDRWATPEENQDYLDYRADCSRRIEEAAHQGRDQSVFEVTGRNSRWTAYFDYWNSLMTSADPDQVSILDYTAYHDTGENWPVREGYGALIARHGADLPIRLNCAVERIDWSGSRVQLTTTQGELSAGQVIISVSTGILNAGDIRFTPELPWWKQQAIAALPLGHYNNIALRLKGNPFGADYPGRVNYFDDDDTALSLKLRPFGHDYIYSSVGGRFAEWLEKRGVATAADHLQEILKKIFGSDIARFFGKTTVSAWSSDPWIKGAYSAALPGQAGQRRIIGRPVAGKLFFAGEATSTDAFCTAHGAYLSGQRAVQDIA